MRKIKLCMTYDGFSQKPSRDRQYKDWVDAMGNPVSEYQQQSMTITKNVVDIEPIDLAHKLQQGYAWVGSTFQPDHNNKYRRRLEYWDSQQVFAADLDEGSITPEEALDIAYYHEVEPLLIHHTFSSTEEKIKLRVIFVLDEPVEEIDVAKALWLKIGTMYNADVSSSDIIKIYQGSGPDTLTHYNPEAFMTLESFGDLPSIAPTQFRENICLGNSFRATGDQLKLYDELGGWHKKVYKDIKSRIARFLTNPHAGIREGNIVITTRRQAAFTAGRVMGQCEWFYLDFAQKYAGNFFKYGAKWQHPKNYRRSFEEVMEIFNLGLDWGRNHMVDYEYKYKEFLERKKFNEENNRRNSK